MYYYCNDFIQGAIYFTVVRGLLCIAYLLHLIFHLQYDEEFNTKNQALRALEKEMLDRVQRLQEVLLNQNTPVYD